MAELSRHSYKVTSKEIVEILNGYAAVILQDQVSTRVLTKLRTGVDPFFKATTYGKDV